MDLVKLKEKTSSAEDSKTEEEKIIEVLNEAEKEFKIELENLCRVRGDYYKVLNFKANECSFVTVTLHIQTKFLLDNLNERWIGTGIILDRGREKGLDLNKDRNYFLFIFNEILIFYLEAYCVLSHPNLKKIYDEYLERGKEDIFIKYIGSQFSSFFREITGKKEKLIQGGTLFFPNQDFVSTQIFILFERQRVWLQEIVLRTTISPSDGSLFFVSSKNLTAKELKIHFLSCLDIELSDFFAFFNDQHTQDNKFVLPPSEDNKLALSPSEDNKLALSPSEKYTEVLSCCYSLEDREKIKEIFRRNLVFLFGLKFAKRKLVEEDERGERLLVEMRFTHFITEFFDELSILDKLSIIKKKVKKNYSLYSFFQEMCYVASKKGRTKDEEMSYFLKMIDDLSSNPSDFLWEITFFSEDIDSLCCEGWEICCEVYEKLVIPIKEENFSVALRNNYRNFLFLDFIPPVEPVVYWLYNELKIKELEEDFFEKKKENFRKIKKFCRTYWIENKKKEELVRWRGCTFPVQEALDCLEEACCVYNNPILERIYDSFLKKGKGELFVKLVGLFRKKIEDKISEDKKPFFISDQSQEWLSEKILEVAEELDKNSSLENNDIKEILILSYEAEVEILNEILKYKFRVLQVTNRNAFNKYKEKEVILSILRLNSLLELYPEELLFMFQEHLKTISNFKIYNWKEDKKNISGKKEFIEFWKFRESLFNSPWDYLYQFEKEIEEKTNKEEWIRNRDGRIKNVWWNEKRAEDFRDVGDNFYYESWDFSYYLFKNKNVCDEYERNGKGDVSHCLTNKDDNQKRDEFFSLKNGIITGFITFLILGGIFLILPVLRRKNNYFQKKK